VTKKVTNQTHIKSMLLFHGIKVPDEFDNSNWTIAFIAWLEEIKFSTSCGDLALQEKIRMFKFIKSFRNCQSNALIVENNKKDYNLLKSIPGIGGY
jgi:hypothetical protein